MQLRFGLHPQMDADLISEIEKIANGGSLNDAARFYLRFLHRQSKGQNMTPEQQIADNISTDSDINLSSLDDQFSEFEE